ncbi:MAG TPA: serine protease [Thermoleophilaceae bacterium]|nr:serine protease [Thermoleophilaceae bacterium]
MLAAVCRTLAATARTAAAALPTLPAATRTVAAAFTFVALAASLGGCAEDSASSRAAPPRLVSVLGVGSERAIGFAVAANRVVTVAHAVEGNQGVRVRVGGGSRRARILRVDRRADLALLAVPGLRASTADIATAGNEDTVRVMVLRGDRSEALPAVVRRAIDARVNAPGADRPLRRPALELEARTRAGDSGAPVVTEAGAVAGVVFARSRNNRDTAYAVDARALDQLLAEGRA